MIVSPAAVPSIEADAAADFDAVIIGAGVSGLYQLHKLRELGLKVRVFKTGAGVGGTWVTGLIRYARDHNLTRIEATPAGVAQWTDHVKGLGEGLLMNEIDSWMTGVNRNVEGKETRKIMRYSGGHPAFRAHCDAAAADGYCELALA